MARVLNAVTHPLGLPHLLDQSLRWSDEALRRAEHTGDPVLQFFTRTYRATLMPTAGNFDEWDRCLEEAQEIAERLDQPIIRWAYTFLAAARAQAAGDLDRADELATRAFEIGTACGQPDAITMFGATAMNVGMHRGEVTAFVPMLEQFIDDYPDVPVYRCWGALMYIVDGRADDAREILEGLAATEFACPLEWGWLSFQCCFADLVVEFRDVDSARVLMERLVPFAGLIPHSGIATYHPVSHTLGGLAAVLGRYGDADRYYATAARALRTSRHEVLRNRKRPRLGPDAPRTRRHRRRRQSPRNYCVKTQAAAAAHGYGYLERRATDALQHAD